MIYHIVNFFRKQWLLFLALFFLWFLYYSRIFLFGQVFYLGDSFAFDLPHRIFLINTLKQGQLPLWNPYILSGVPFLLIGSFGIVNPGTLLFLLFSPPLAMTLITVFNNLLSGIFMYLFVFLITKRKIASFFAGMIYMFSGFAANMQGAIVVMQELPLIPLAFITVEKAISKEKKFYLVLTGMVLALQFLSGFPFVSYLTSLAITLYYLLEKRKTILKKLFDLGFIALTAIGFSSFLLLPQLEANSLSTRPRASYSYATSHSLSPLSLITFILPHFYGLGEIELSLNTHNRTYLGILPLAVIFFTLIFKRNLVKKSLLLLTIGGFFLSFGKYFPFYRFFLFIPGLSYFREPEFFLVLYLFGGSVISGQGLEYLLSQLSKVRKVLKSFYKLPFQTLLVFFCLLTLLLIIYLKFAPESFWESLIKFLQPIFFGDKSISVLISKTEKIKSLALINLSNTLFFLLVLFITLGFLKATRNKKKIFLFLTGVTFIDLFLLNQSEFFLIDREKFQEIFTPSIPKVLISQKDETRIHSIVHPEPKNWASFSRDSYIQDNIRKNTDVLYPNSNMAYQIASVDGFSPLLLKSYTNYISERQDLLVGVTNYDVPETSEKLGKAGARFVLSDRIVDEFKPPRYKLLEENPPHFFLYEDREARKRTFLLDETDIETGEAKIIRSTANSLVISTQSEKETSLILLDTYYPGWEALVDGEKVEIKPFENTFRQIDLKPGVHVVNFIFRPQSFYRGLAVTLITVILLLLLIIYKILKRS